MTPLRWVGRAVGAAVLLVIVLTAASPAGAHAILVSSTPGDGARLDEGPAEVSLEFNEPVTADLGGLRVFDADGERVDRGSVAVDGDTISVAVEDLDAGAYVVSYRIVSADNHPVRGGIVFTVGDGDADSASLDRLLGDDADRAWEIAGAVGRWLAMGGSLVAVGAVAFVGWCRPERSRRLEVAVRIAVAVGVVSTLWSVPVQAALATGTGAGSLLESGVLSSVLADGFGLSVGLAVVGLVVIAVTLWTRWWIAAVAAAAVVVSFPLIGHTRFDDVAIGFASDIVHVLAAAVWTGGVVFLLLSRSDGEDRTRIVGRFSTLATVSIVAVGVAGLALSWTEVKQLRALTSTTYGWLLVAKIACVAVIAAAGAYNHFRLVPALTSSPDDAVRRRLHQVLRFEAIGFVVVLAVTAVLVNVTPAYVDAGIGQIHSEILEVGDAGSVQLVVDPNRAGENSLHLYFYDPDGRPAEIAEDVQILLSKPGDDIGPIERTPYRAGPAHFQWDGNELVNGGRWDITVVARIDRFNEQTVTTDVLVGS